MSLIIQNQLDVRSLPELIRFFGANHGENHVMTNKVMIDYFFYNEDEDSYSLIVAISDDKIIGILGYIPTIFRWLDGKQNDLEGAWTSHWTVDVQHRNGVGVLLMKRLQELYPIVAGQGANQLNKKIVTKMGHNFLDDMGRSIKVYDWSFLTKVFFNLNLTKLKPAELNEFNTVPVEGFLEIEVQSGLTSSSYQPDWDAYPDYAHGTKKSFQYIKKKYIDHPIFEYLFLSAGPINQPCLLVYRLEKTSGLSVFNCIRIVDVIVPNIDKSSTILRALFGKLDQFAKKNNVIFMDFYCTSEYVHKIIEPFGFVREPKHTLPNLLNPIVEIALEQNIEQYLRDQRQPVWSEIYFTKSDGDQDRPNIGNLRDLEKSVQ